MSDPVFWKVGQSYTDYFVYPESGLVNGDWTKEVAKNGANLVSTLTVANVNADTRYYLSASGSTGFPAATGSYQLVVYKTALPLDKRTVVVNVTSNGLPSGTMGFVSFTAVAANGRVTDDASVPLDGATVTILRPNGDPYTEETTDSNGLWGPVYFDEVGTFTATATKPGYSNIQFTLVVTLLTVTGPGTDLELTSVTTAPELTLAALIGYGRPMFVDRQGAQANTLLTQSVNDALEMLCGNRDWPWLYTTGRIDLNAAYTTGTVQVTDGDATVILTGGTFPAWAADGDILINGTWTPVLSLTDPTHLEMEDAWFGGSLPSTTFVLCQYRYDLPADCRTIVNIGNQQGWLWGSEPVGRLQIEQLRVLGIGGTWSPKYATERNQLAIWSYPTTNLQCNLLYYRRPARLAAGSDVADWDINLLEVLHRAIDFQISLRGTCVAGDSVKTWAAYESAYKRAIPNDRATRPRGVGFGGKSVPANPGIPMMGNTITGI